MTEAELIELLAELPDLPIVVQDYGDFDDASNLDRDGVFRLNVHVGRERLQELVPEGDVDPTAFDVVMPHPVYAAQGGRRSSTRASRRASSSRSPTPGGCAPLTRTRPTVSSQCAPRCARELAQS